MNSMMVNRIADFIFAFCGGERDETVRWLVSLGCEVVHVQEVDGPPRTWTIQGIAGVRSALCADLGPLDQVPVFGFLLAGMLWPQVYRGLGTEVDRRLKQPKRDAIEAEKLAEKEALQRHIASLPPDVPPAPRRMR